ncbi:von Willebrand factor A domain-containing protein 5A-like isoform X4 [Synchiropus splendidus]|uniref:von Willebrand factor A domain-containing protein 5A-like isoform X4 n=1 Tax=Synchiropus splendidus TaxID=270530 RepID=UPI00237E3C0A|nr:von Willebrand factor A domain-containing protein 5A-like isoform X4 [Synchiropus splendidus]
MVNCCGLVTLKNEPVPLKSIAVELEVQDHVATVVSTLLYENKEENPVEACFVFPLPGDAAVCHFSAKIGQTEIVAQVKEKEQAREEYDDALSSGQQAFLLEESEQSPDIFSLSVGSLPPGESASIRLEYVTELAVQADDGLRFCLPGVLNPRYEPRESQGETIQVMSAPASQISYTLSFSARMSSSRPVARVESNSSLEPLQYLNTGKTQATVKLADGHKFDRDIELLIYYEDAHQPSAVVEAGQASAKPGSMMADPVVMVSLYPEFPKDVMSSMSSCGEFVFLLDRSGSMGRCVSSSKTEMRIQSARDTLVFLLKSLPMGCYFNIYSFGTAFEHVFPKSVEYSQKTMDEALKKVGKMGADLGGTEILEPLKSIYKQSCIPKHPRQLFVFTDGGVSNTKAVIDLVKSNAGSHRCFSFGIGEGASTALINGLAKEGGGHAQFITGAERMQPKVMQSLRFSLQPAVVDISVTWDMPSVTTLSPPITTLFQGQRSIIYAQLSGETTEAEGGVTVKYSLAGQPSQNQLRFSLAPTGDTGLTVHRLAARTLIRSLETQESRKQDEVKPEVVDLSVQSGVSSSFTSFIAVNKSSNEAVKGPLLQRNVLMAAQVDICSALIAQVNICSARSAAPRMMKMCSALSAAETCSMDSGQYAQALMCSIPKAADMCSKNFVQLGGAPTRSKSFGFGFLQKLRLKPRAQVNICSAPNAAPRMMKMCSAPNESSRDSPPPKDLLLQVVTLQKASGCWELDSNLAAVFSKSVSEVEKPKPQEVTPQVWATMLALIWLHGFKSDDREEWELLSMKAVSWLKAQNAPSLDQCVAAGNQLLGCSVTKDLLGV